MEERDDNYKGFFLFFKLYDVHLIESSTNHFVVY